MVDIATIHEFGAFVKGKTGKGHTVPARPFIGPVLKKFSTKAGEIYAEAMKKFLANPPAGAGKGAKG